MTAYVFVKRLDAGIVGLTSEFGQQLWTLVVTRKARKCEDCGTQIAVKSKAWSPITNQNNRMHRLCVPCVTRLEQAQ